MAHVLIAGLPGAGKTHFCRWLEADRHYHHIEADHAAVFDPAVQLLVAAGTVNVSRSAESFKARGPDVVLEWGFPPPALGRVRQLVKAGFEPWWFGGDEGAARLAYLARGDRPVEAFDGQVASIRASWVRIARVFDGRVLETVRAAGSGFAHLPPEEILLLMGERMRSGER